MTNIDVPLENIENTDTISGTSIEEVDRLFIYEENGKYFGFEQSDLEGLDANRYKNPYTRATIKDIKQMKEFFKESATFKDIDVAVYEKLLKREIAPKSSRDVIINRKIQELMDIFTHELRLYIDVDTFLLLKTTKYIRILKHILKTYNINIAIVANIYKTLDNIKIYLTDNHRILLFYHASMMARSYYNIAYLDGDKDTENNTIRNSRDVLENMTR